MKVIHGTRLEAAIVKLLENAEFAKIAVAYWGKGAVTRLIPPSLNPTKTLIVCDFMSGFCNPAEIETLIDRFGGLKGEPGKGRPYSGVAKQKMLHAKVWLTDKAAILGSSNASANGLGQEGNETIKSAEANLYIDDRQTLDAIGEWFASEINPKPISKMDIQRIIALRQVPARRRLIDSGTLLSALKTNPADFKGDKLFVWIWNESKPSLKALKRIGSEEKDRGIRKIEFWEGAKELDPDSHVIHFNVANGKASLAGLSRVLREDPYIKPEKLLLCKTVDQFRQLKLGDKVEWVQAANKAVLGRRLPIQLSAEEFARKYLVE
jgi:hypothetical protein